MFIFFRYFRYFVDGFRRMYSFLEVEFKVNVILLELVTKEIRKLFFKYKVINYFLCKNRLNCCFYFFVVLVE